MYLIINSISLILISLMIWLYFKSTKREKWYRFKNIASLVSALLVIIAVWLSVMFNQQTRDEYARKPELSLILNESNTIESNNVVRSLKIVNKGNIETSILAVYLVVLKEDKVHLHFDVWNKDRVEKGKVYYRYDRVHDLHTTTIAANGGNLILYTYDITFDSAIHQIEYEIAYVSKYASGSKSGFLDFD